MTRTLMAIALSLATALPAAALETFTFDNIDGGTIDTADWAGHPVLVVNTASRCGFTPQYEGLQALYDDYRDEGLIVLAVPSDDFRQELASAEEVKEFCEVNFGLTLPMTDITPVRGPGAHPFYRWVEKTAGFTPSWNFNKVLIAPDGSIVATFGATARPNSSVIVTPIKDMLAGS